MDNETIMAVPDLAVAISDTSWCTLPNEFPAICPDLEAITVVPSFILVTHETEECHVNRCHAKLEGFKVKAKVLTKTMKDLTEKGNQNLQVRVVLGCSFKFLLSKETLITGFLNFG